MAFRTRTEYINDMFVSTYAASIGSVRDQIFDAKKSAFWAILRNKGGMMSQLGGDKIKFNLEYAKNTELNWLAKGGEVNLQDFEHLDQARYGWYYVEKPIVRFWQDDQQNEGEAEVVDMIESKINNTINAFAEDIDGALLADLVTTGDLNTQNDETGTKLPTLQHIITPDGTGTVGEIVAGTKTWWKNQFLDYDATTDYVETVGSPSDADWLNTGVSAMRLMVKNCRNKTDLIMCDWHMFNLMQDDLLTYFQWDGRLAADLGLPTNTPTFDGIPVMWVENAPAGLMYFLNMDDLKFVYDPRYFLTMGPWLPLARQPNDMVAHVTLACSLVCSERRYQGVIHGLPTA